MTARASRITPLALAAATVAAIGAATVGTAWAFEIWGGYVPCPLCLEQRVPYYIAVPLAALVTLTAAVTRRRALARLGLAAAGLVFVWGAYLAAYHAGAEWQWWPGPSGCAADAAATTDAGGMLGALREAELVRCDEAPWRLLGLSFAGWNFVISVALAAIAFAGAAATRPYGSSSASQ